MALCFKSAAVVKPLFQHLSPILRFKQSDYFSNCRAYCIAIELSTEVFWVNLDEWDVIIQDQGDCRSKKMYLDAVLNAWPKIISVVEKLTRDECVAVGAVFSKASLECVLGVKHVLKSPIVP